MRVQCTLQHECKYIKTGFLLSCFVCCFMYLSSKLSCIETMRTVVLTFLLRHAPVVYCKNFFKTIKINGWLTWEFRDISGTMSLSLREIFKIQMNNLNPELKRSFTEITYGNFNEYTVKMDKNVKATEGYKKKWCHNFAVFTSFASDQKNIILVG